MAVCINLKKQINSIYSILQITKAMRLVATTKLKKIEKKINKSKLYFSEIYTVFNDIINNTEHSIYQEQDKPKINKKICWLIINSNLGLCGGYNINLNKLALKEIKKDDIIIGIGSKSKLFYTKRGYKVDYVYNNIYNNFSYESSQEIALELLSNFNAKKYDEIKIVYTKFINNVTFEPTILQLLPIIKRKTSKANLHNNVIIEFEPDASTIFESAVPMYLNSIIFSTIIESQLSEQASRRLAMENASENASDMLDKLSLEYNRKRQAAITQEISEIVVGANT